jgi:hypothetical protein
MFGGPSKCWLAEVDLEMGDFSLEPEVRLPDEAVAESAMPLLQSTHPPTNLPHINKALSDVLEAMSRLIQAHTWGRTGVQAGSGV